MRQSSLFGDGTFGVSAAICRDQFGIFLGASAIKLKYVSKAATLEALAIREGQALAEDVYVNWIHIASDCKTVVNDIKKKISDGVWSYSTRNNTSFSLFLFV